MSVRTCGYLKEDGIPCGSLALRGKKLCYYHLRDHKRQQYAAAVIRRADVLGPHLPRMRSLEDIQMALYEVCNAILDDRVPTQRAGAILFSLQQAAAPFHKPVRN